jgi:hypothetical protein
MLRCYVLGLGIVVFGSLAIAQVGSSTITGRITDSTGAVIPRVSVSIVQIETNFQFTGVTNQDGLYRVPSLSPGTYRINYEATGFKKLVRDGIELRAGDVLAVDIVLEIGTVNESVQVTGAAPLLETETSATGALVEGDTLHKLPLYQRYVNSTLNLVPGMSMGGYGYGGDFGAYHVAGQRNSTIGLFEDGVNANEQLSGTVGIKPIQNSVEEVKVLTTTLPAEYGHSAGGVVAAVKKSGTNEFHGLAADYGRVRRMQHRLYFDRLRTSDPQPGNPNGVPTWFMFPEANASGPILIPKVYDGRNKTFFFFGYQKLIEKKSAQVLVNTPTDAMKAGDVSYGGLGQPIYDPASTRRNPDSTWARDPFPTQSVPLRRFDPVARKILGYNPWVSPNAPGGNSPTGPITNLITNENSRTFFEDFSGRVDHQVSANFKFYGSYTYNHQSGLNRPTNISIKAFDGSQGFESPFTGQNYSVGNTWVISPSTINDIRVGYYRRRNDQFSYSAGQNWAQTLGIPGVSGELMPQFGASGADRYGDSGLWGLIGNGNNRLINETISLRDDLTKVHGTHAFKMGYEILHFRVNSTVTNRPSGAFFFDGMTAGLQANGVALPNTGSTWAGFLLGSVRQATFDGELTSWLPRSSIHSFYIQDDWKITPTLTANLGLRYSNESPFTTKYGLMSNFDPTGADNVVAGGKGVIVHPTGSLNQRDNNNFQPRVGLAWHPKSKVVFRGGFAVNTVDVKFPLLRAQFDEYVTQINLQRAPGDPTQLFQLSNGPGAFPVNVRPNNTSGFVGTNYSGRNVEWWDPNLHNPYVLNWNSSVQYQLSNSYVLDLSYQGSSGVDLLERWNLNTFPIDFGMGNPALQNQALAASQNFRPYPNFGNVYLRSNFGHSTYHGGTVKVEKRFSDGLTFSTFYTFSKAIDSQDNDNDGSGVAPVQNRRLEKARASYDRNHRFIAYATYQLPIGQGKHFMNRGGFLNAVFGGWEIAWIQTLESGNPYTFSFTGSPYNYFPGFAGNQRPDVIHTPSLLPNWGDMGGDRFNQANRRPIIDMNNFAYPGSGLGCPNTLPATLTGADRQAMIDKCSFLVGNSGRNIMTGTRLLWSEVSAQKNWRIKERVGVQLRWDFQNPFHNYNWSNPTLTVNYRDPSSFGKITADQRTASVGGQALMNLTLQVTW